MTLTEYKEHHGLLWRQVAHGLTEAALAVDHDKMNRIYENRMWALIKGARPKDWEQHALEDYCGEGVTFN